jgi:hypothetical protein
MVSRRDAFPPLDGGAEYEGLESSTASGDGLSTSSGLPFGLQQALLAFRQLFSSPIIWENGGSLKGTFRTENKLDSQKFSYFVDCK